MAAVREGCVAVEREWWARRLLLLCCAACCLPACPKPLRASERACQICVNCQQTNLFVCRFRAAQCYMYTSAEHTEDCQNNPRLRGDAVYEYLLEMLRAERDLSDLLRHDRIAGPACDTSSELVSQAVGSSPFRSQPTPITP